MSFTASRRKSVVRYSTEVLDWRDRIVTAGGQVSKDTLRLHDRFISALKNINLWDSLIEIGTFSGVNLTSALVKLKYPTGGQSALTNHNFVADDYRELGGGLQGGATKYLQTGTLLSTLGETGSLFFLSRSLAAGIMLGLRDAAADSGAYLGNDGAAGSFSWSASVGLTPMTVLTADSALGLLAGLATDDTLTAYSAGIAAATGDVGALPSGAAAQALEFYVFAENLNGVATSIFAGRGSFYALGTDTFTAAQMTQLWGAVQSLQSGLLRTGNQASWGEPAGLPLGDANKTLGET